LLGAGVKVIDGATVGDGVILGSGAVVTKAIEPYSVAVGVPAKTITLGNKHILKREEIT
jgi:acetyltransferase-like isoleucine patch superfamily enzyme